MNDPVIRLPWPAFVYELAELIKSISNAPPLYLVGGAVRDAYLRRAIGDIDVAVDGDAIMLARLVADAWKADIYIMDRERDVARVFVSRDDRAFTIDFARFRGVTLADDLRDRDFTVNAMAADLLGDPGVLIDPLEGLADLRMKILRRCSPRSIANDPLRVLRAVRLSAQFELKIHPLTAKDMRGDCGKLRLSSPERVRDEFFKLLGLEQAARGLRVLAHIGALGQALPLESGKLDAALAVVERMRAMLTAISSRRTDNTAAAFDLGMLVIQLDRFRPSLQAHLDQVYGNGRSHAQLLMLAALLHQDGARTLQARDRVSSRRAEAAARSLRLTKDESRKLPAAVANCGVIIERESWTALDLHRFWHRLNESGIDAILLGAAIVLGTEGSRLQQAEWLRTVEGTRRLLDAYFNRYDEIVNPKPLLDGRDLQDLLGIGSCPKVGRVLTALREAQATGEIGSIEEAREFALRWAEGGR